MTVDTFFSENSPLLSVIEDFKVRKYQKELSVFISQCIDNYLTSVIEAPTGSGKTLAYLIPALLSDRKIIISTKSKQLMNQIFYKDIAQLINGGFAEKKISILKGKKNYFCLYRYSKYILPYVEEYSDIVTWYENSKDRFILEVPVGFTDEDIYDKISADSFQCLSTKCDYFSKCSFYRAREKANASDIVITNHHLLLTDVAAKSKSQYLSNFEGFEHIIFDEAHSIVDIFPLYAGDEIAISNIKKFLKEHVKRVKASEFLNIQNKIKLFESSVDKKEHFNEKFEKKLENIISDIKEYVLPKLDEEDRENFAKIENSFSYIKEHDGIKIIENSGKSVTIKLLPLKINDIFYKGLMKTCLSAIFISATLTVNNSFNFYKNELGLPEDTLEYIVNKNSFKKNSVYVVPEDIKSKKDIYKDAVTLFKGPMLIIFNSIKMMEEIYLFLKENIQDKNIILQQNINIGEYLADKNDVILGCAVLREGIDIKTNCKSKCVILDKLPFENISDIYLQMKANLVKEEGRDPFMSFYLPRAVIYFKQAIGRLIRGEDDYGICIVLDDRMLKKGYGRFFLESIDDGVLFHNVKEAINFLEENYGRD